MIHFILYALYYISIIRTIQCYITKDMLSKHWSSCIAWYCVIFVPLFEIHIHIWVLTFTISMKSTFRRNLCVLLQVHYPYIDSIFPSLFILVYCDKSGKKPPDQNDADDKYRAIYYLIASGILLLIDNKTTWLHVAVAKRKIYDRVYKTGAMLLWFCKIWLFATQYSLYGQTRSFEVLYDGLGPTLLYWHQTEEAPITKCKVFEAFDQ